MRVHDAETVERLLLLMQALRVAVAERKAQAAAIQPTAKKETSDQ